MYGGKVPQSLTCNLQAFISVLKSLTSPPQVPRCVFGATAMNYIEIKKENDRIYSENKHRYTMCSQTFSEISPTPEVQRKKVFRISENTEKLTSTGCILAHTNEGRITALNFANAMYAGGGYVLGGNAQEESLCRSSMLYYTIKTQYEYYRANRKHILPDYTDLMIYSCDVPVIRDESGSLLEVPQKCDFITCPAVNRTFAKFMFSQKNIDLKMKKRIEKIIFLAVENSPDILVLGAFGCGMFGNKREKVFPMFEEAVNRYVPDEIRVIFAVP